MASAALPLVVPELWLLNVTALWVVELGLELEDVLLLPLVTDLSALTALAWPPTPSFPLIGV